VAPSASVPAVVVTDPVAPQARELLATATATPAATRATAATARTSLRRLRTHSLLAPGHTLASALLI
jgi:hypothetical protein